MAARVVTYQKVFSEALIVCQQLGTWFLYQIRDANNLEHFRGYLLYRGEDFKRRRAVEMDRLQDSENVSDNPVVRLLADRAARYARACRFVTRLDVDTYSNVAARIIADLEKHPDYKNLPYVSELEKRTDQSKDYKDKYKPKRNTGRPSTRKLRKINFKPCPECKGQGMIRK